MQMCEFFTYFDLYTYIEIYLGLIIFFDNLQCYPNSTMSLNLEQTFFVVIQSVQIAPVTCIKPPTISIVISPLVIVADFCSEHHCNR